ncbi:MAG: signal recognition particle receptor subunit alpha, partial [Saezia sp.]
MFSFFRKKKKEEQTPSPSDQTEEISTEVNPAETNPEADHNITITKEEQNLTDLNNTTISETQHTPIEEPSHSIEKIEPTAQPQTPSRQGWLSRLSTGLKRTGQNITDVFTGGTQIDDALYEELEAALLMADAGTAATQYLLKDVKQRVKETRTTDPRAVRGLLAQSLEQLIKPLEAALLIGEHTPTVIMVAGVNGAGKTTSIGKLTRHLANGHHKVLLAAGDTFRAAAREQLEVWADRNQVEIISQQGGDPASVSF